MAVGVAAAERGERAGRGGRARVAAPARRRRRVGDRDVVLRQRWPCARAPARCWSAPDGGGGRILGRGGPAHAGTGGTADRDHGEDGSHPSSSAASLLLVRQGELLSVRFSEVGGRGRSGPGPACGQSDVGDADEDDGDEHQLGGDRPARGGRGEHVGHGRRDEPGALQQAHVLHHHDVGLGGEASGRGCCGCSRGPRRRPRTRSPCAIRSRLANVSSKAWPRAAVISASQPLLRLVRLVRQRHLELAGRDRDLLVQPAVVGREHPADRLAPAGRSCGSGPSRRPVPPTARPA